MFSFCSSLLQCFISLSCLATFAATAVSGLFLILAPEEPSLKLGGGDLYALVPGIVLLVVAIVTIPLGVFGCLSVRYDSSKRLIIYTIFAVIVSVVTVLCASVLFTFTYTNMISNNLNSTLWEKVKSAHPDSNDTIFDIQTKYKCCGVHNGSDWLDPSTEWYKHFSENVPLPPSCVVRDVTYFDRGCKDVLFSRLQLVVNVSFGIAVAAALLQLLTAGLTCYGNKIISKYQTYDIF